MSNEVPWAADMLARSAAPGVRAVFDRCLALALRSELPGTLMLLGPAGLGREGLALDLAAALICRVSGGVGCGCEVCQRVRRGMHPDVTYLDVLPGKSQILIDEQVRPLLASVPMRPFEGPRRVVVVTSAHTPPLGADAAAAMLKTLEEPPAHVTFLLLASNAARCLPTIVSRSVLIRVPVPDAAPGVAAGVTPDVWWHARGAADSPAIEMLAAALGGDGLALVQTAVAAKADPWGLPGMAARLTAAAAASDAASAEALLDGAAAVLAAEQRRRALHIDAEVAAVGALASQAARSGTHSS